MYVIMNGRDRHRQPESDMRACCPRMILLNKITGPPFLVDNLQARILLELALGPAGQAAVRPERDAAVPGRCVARVGG